MEPIPIKQGNSLTNHYMANTPQVSDRVQLQLLFLRFWQARLKNSSELGQPEWFTNDIKYPFPTKFCNHIFRSITGTNNNFCFW